MTNLSSPFAYIFGLLNRWH